MTGRRNSLAPARQSVRAVKTAFVILAGCAVETPVTPRAEPVPAARPAIPDGWRMLTSDEGDIHLVVPPGAAVLITAGSILVQVPSSDPNTPFEIWATGPSAVVQPTEGQSTVQWLEQSGFMAEERAGIVRGPTTEREILLPAGPAREVTTSVQPGTPDEGGAILYAVTTARGVAILRFVGRPGFLAERALEIELISQLVEFAD